MSFLAQLRQQHQQSTLQLSYHLRPQGDALQLSLQLATFTQGQLRDTAQAYALQREHLNSPPAFLTALDVGLLRQLVESNAAWADSSQGQLLGTQCIEFVPQLLATQRCFYGCQQPLSLGEPFASAPFWRLEADAAQSLQWTHPANSQLWQTKPLLSFENNQLRLGATDLPAQALKILSAQTPLSAFTARQFLNQLPAEWAELNLPRPQNIQPQQRAALLKVQLVCRSNNSKAPPQDWLALRFIYQTDSHSWLNEAPHFTDRWAWINENEVFYAAADTALEHQWQTKLNNFFENTLPGDFIITAPGQWQAGQKNSWRQLLIEQSDALNTLGVCLISAPGFRFPYTPIDHWAVDIRTQGDLFQLTIEAVVDDTTINIKELLTHLRQLNFHNTLHEIEIALNGKIFVLPCALAGSLCAELSEMALGGQYFPKNQLYRLTELIQTLPQNTQWHGATQLKDQAAHLQKQPELLNLQLTGLQATLRPYQWLGVCWLQHLKNANFSGLLADDMGLGKTLQTIAHLSVEKHQGQLQQPVLIIAPTSLLTNWACEIKRFAPYLSTRIVQGQQRHLQRQPQHQLQHKRVDIYITSYPLAVKDSEYWKAQTFSWLILDEAQAIKNPSTQVSRALRQFNAGYRLCLSGTPVENHLGELWSLMDFLQPGFLGNQAEFKQYYQKPIEQDGNAHRLQQLQQRIAPLMMRRTKNQVAKDLPLKTQIEQFIPLSQSQQVFYDQLHQDSKQELHMQLEATENQGEQQILVLAALLRLRQACCDPALLGEPQIPSAKTEACLEMLQALAAEERFTLVFSQFTRMLDILAAQLTHLGIEYRLLTGQTKNRAQLVEEFQAGMAPVFLISLKAGGVGLNLTKADTVIHFDPWWNAAARDQASDRAHRIGQTQPVFVYNLIAEGTIEEKIAQLQTAKDLLGQQINQSAQQTGVHFTLKLEDLLNLWQDDEAKRD